MEHLGGYLSKKEVGIIENIKTTYTTIIHHVREDLKISLTEYCVADVIQRLSSGEKSRQLGGWCYAGKQFIGDCLGVDKRTIERAINKLILLKLLEKDLETKYLRTTGEWYRKVETRKAKISRIVK